MDGERPRDTTAPGTDAGTEGARLREAAWTDSDGDAAGARSRFVDWARGFVRAEEGEKLIRFDSADVRAQFEAGWRNLVTAAGVAEEIGRFADAARILLETAPFLRRSFRTFEFESVVERAVAVAEKADDSGLKASALNAAGEMRLRRHEVAEARTLHEMALAIARPAGHFNTDIVAQMGLARCAAADGWADEAETWSVGAIKLARQSAYGPLLTVALVRAAECFAQVDLQRARMCAEEAVITARVQQMTEWEAAALCCLADIAAQTKNTNRVPEQYLKVIQIYGCVGDEPSRAAAYLRLGDCYKRLKRANDAEKCYLSALEAAVAAGDVAGQSEPAARLSDLAASEGQTEAAVSVLRDILRRCEAGEQTQIRYRLLVALAEARVKQGRQREAADIFADILSATDAQFPILQRASIRIDLGKALLSLQRIDEAVETFVMARTQCRKAGAVKLEFQANLNLADAYLHKKDWESALLTSGANYPRTVISEYDSMHLQTVIGVAYLRTGAADRARAAFETSYDTAKALNDLREMGLAHARLAEIEEDIRRPAEALRLLTLAATELRETRYPVETLGVIIRLGEAALAARALDRAEAAFREATVLAGKIGAVAEEMRAWRLLGRTGFLRRGNALAEHAYTNALQCCVRCGDAKGEANALNDLADVAEARGTLDLAVALRLQALEIVNRVEDNAGAAETQRGLARVYGKLGRTNDAIGTLRQAIELYGRRGEHETTAQLSTELAGLIGAQGTAEWNRRGQSLLMRMVELARRTARRMTGRSETGSA